MKEFVPIGLAVLTKEKMCACPESAHWLALFHWRF